MPLTGDHFERHFFDKISYIFLSILRKMMEYFIDAFRKYAEFNGRASRKAYWMYYLFYLLFYLVAGGLDAFGGAGLFFALYCLTVLVPGIAITARRLHDTDRSGWWQLIYLIPVIGWIVMLVFLLQDSQPDNEYGNRPLS
ncbi:DUF805 domain-containing protein [Endozoicomonas sp. 8E]|uniref:DUF805 domain-containing protein n=1 Tax=Endozoicomonas sp. 8E TaxID=3035692 RepID=UPI002938FF35|nr:DUF805 domain-containing protein [Endozoicomonas sp. 8E]WOG26264.1 DUF805 domain-containing protein [Endozoicomonas sp. 8E]